MTSRARRPTAAQRARRRGAAVAGLTAYFWLIGTGSDAAARPAAPGTALLAAAERAAAVVVGVVAEVQRLDAAGCLAELRVERSLAGEPMERRRVAWEEPSPARPARLAVGDRIAVALDDLPGNSSWRRRLPDGNAWMIAAEGNAFARDPTATAVDALATYLAIPVSQRHGAAGSIALADLAAGGDPALAEAALLRLASPTAAIPEPVVDRLLAIAADRQHPPALRSAALDVIARRRLLAARPRVAELAEERELRAAALATVGELAGGLPDPTVEALLSSDRASERIVGARFATGGLAERQLPAAVRGDPDPRVRAAAAAAATRTNTSWGLAAAIDALADPAPEVRGAATTAIAALGAVALPALDSEIANATPAAPGAIATLALMGSHAGTRVADIARSHRDERLRAVALLALGRVPDEHAGHDD